MRFTFAGGPAEWAMAAPSGNAGVVKSLANLSGGTAWSAQVNGTPYTDLVATGTDPAPITTDANGYLRPFLGPDGVASLWVDFGAGQRFYLQAREVGTLLGSDGKVPAAKVGDLSGTYDRAGMAAALSLVFGG